LPPPDFANTRLTTAPSATAIRSVKALLRSAGRASVGFELPWDMLGLLFGGDDLLAARWYLRSSGGGFP
jgi:hypothetical protein